MHGRIELNEFKALCHRIDDLLSSIEGDSSELRGQLTEILMAQDFQDLTGQIIRRVITLVSEVEQRLVGILTVFGSEQLDNKTEGSKPASQSKVEAEGPILNPYERNDAVASQDEVDDLLSSLGF
jgi:chemotaxis protein CheZ